MKILAKIDNGAGGSRATWTGKPARVSEPGGELIKLIAEETEFDHEFCARYYRENLRFNFGEKEKEGLREFQRLCENHGLLPKREIEFNLV